MTDNISSTGKSSWQLLPFGYCAEYSLTIAIKKWELPEIVSHIYDDLLCPIVEAAPKLKDVKGRDISQALIPISQTPKEGELFYIGGKVYSAEQSNGSYLEEPFSLSLVTNFDSFEGSHHIIHQSKIERRGPLPESITFKTVGKVFPLSILNMRLGLQFFRSKFITSMFGFSPSVTETLLIDCSTEEFNLWYKKEGQQTKEFPFLESHNLSTELNKLTEMLFSFNVIDDYNNKIKS